MEKTCADCCHFSFTEEFYGQTAYHCRLTRALLSGKPCKAFNVDLSNESICINCQEFLGGGDWGLACRKHYHRLPEPLTEACEDFKKKADDAGE